MVYRVIVAAIFGFCVCLQAMKASSYVLSDESMQDVAPDNFFLLQAVDPSAARELAYFLHETKTSQKAHKRNSEIINSLLGLPKVLNDAGR